MLDARKMKMIELKLSQPTMTNADIAKAIGVSRKTVWKWSMDGEVKAELNKRLRAINQNATHHLNTQTGKLMDEMLTMALDPTTEARVKNSALQYLLDRSLGRASEQINIDITNETDSTQVLSDFKDFLKKSGYLKEVEE